MRLPLDPFSEVVNEQRRWDPEWYSWLQELAAVTRRLETAVPPTTDLSGINAQIALLQFQVGTLQSQVGPLPSQVATLQATSPPGLVFLSSQRISSPVATVVFTGLTSAYDAYQFHITALRTSSNNAALWMQISLDGGATWKNTANTWSWVYSYMAGGATPFGHNSISEGSNGYFRIGGATSSTWGNSSEVIVYPNSSQNLNAASWRSLDYYDGGGGVYQVLGSGLEVSDATTLNAVRFLFAAGNIVSGRISIYGLRKT